MPPKQSSETPPGPCGGINTTGKHSASVSQNNSQGAGGDEGLRRVEAEVCRAIGRVAVFPFAGVNWVDSEGHPATLSNCPAGEYVGNGLHGSSVTIRKQASTCGLVFSHDTEFGSYHLPEHAVMAGLLARAGWSAETAIEAAAFAVLARRVCMPGFGEDSSHGPAKPRTRKKQDPAAAASAEAGQSGSADAAEHKPAPTPRGRGKTGGKSDAAEPSHAAAAARVQAPADTASRAGKEEVGDDRKKELAKTRADDPVTKPRARTTGKHADPFVSDDDAQPSAKVSRTAYPPLEMKSAASPAKEAPNARAMPPAKKASSQSISAPLPAAKPPLPAAKPPLPRNPPAMTVPFSGDDSDSGEEYQASSPVKTVSSAPSAKKRKALIADTESESEDAATAAAEPPPTKKKNVFDMDASEDEDALPATGLKGATVPLQPPKPSAPSDVSEIESPSEPDSSDDEMEGSELQVSKPSAVAKAATAPMPSVAPQEIPRKAGDFLATLDIPLMM